MVALAGIGPNDVPVRTSRAILSTINRDVNLFTPSADDREYASIETWMAENKPSNNTAVIVSPTRSSTTVNPRRFMNPLDN